MKKLLILTLTVFNFNNAHAWGKTGHRIVGEIAELNLSTKAKTKIKDLIGEEPLWHTSTWADEIRSDPKWGFSSPWHYVSIPTGKTYFDQKRNKDGDVIEALYRLEDVLRDKTASKEKKIEALKFIVHFVGDLHQPLHVGLAEDRGGNMIKVKWFKDEKNLHQVWDEDIVDFEQLSYSEYAKYLNKFDKAEKENWSLGNYLDWANESMSFRAQVYDLPENKNLGYEYSFKMKPIIEERFKKAGLRLARVFNSVFEDRNLDKIEVENRKKVIDNI